VAVHPEVIGKVGRAHPLGGRTAGFSAEREAVRTHMVAIRCAAGGHPLTPKKRNCDFGYLWLFLVIFIPNIRCNTLY
jgi:hypothetical protein